MNHRVAEQVVELEVSSEAVARALHADVLANFRERVGPVLDAAFDAACPDGGVLRIAELELELSELGEATFLDDLVGRIRERLPVALAGIGRGGAPEEHGAKGVERLSVEDVEQERWERWFASGTLAMRDAGLSASELALGFERALATSPARVSATLQRLPRDVVTRRLAELCPRVLPSVLALLEPVSAELEASVFAWRSVARVLARSPVPAARAAGAAIEETLVNDVRTVRLAARRDEIALLVSDLVIAALRSRVGPVSASELLPAIESVLDDGDPVRVAVARRAKSPDPLDARPPRRRTDRTDALSPEPVARRPASDLAPPPAARGLERELDARPDLAPRHEGLSPALVSDHDAPSDVESRSSSVAGARAPAPSTPSARSSVTRPSTGMLPEPARHPLSPDEAPGVVRRAFRAAFGAASREGTWVARAGLVLVWPFLPALFGALALAPDGRFANAADRRRAALFCAHLANGALEWPEHELVLPKILCGLDVVDPIETRLDADERELGEARELLVAVLAHWTALKSTSVAALRATFFERHGSLQPRDPGYLLELTRTGPDVLLDRLPWGIGLVMLPWMPAPLHVEWR